ncbi:HupE/UreJ family protein [Methyloradius palustris]|uniref:Protein hupE n=1 Tax=Methyloradius palustris TaxID=2778876 RepID=A0A8D5GAC6_9PROT|nr:HupE/UreJ family protein [Methyloradius palustris]BCM26017.1 protein hupE [Methyloradius palustris]
MKKMLLAISFSLFSTLAMAHPGHAEQGALAGFLHPLTGIDHLLVMVSIGMWAAKLGGSARWQLPVTFVLVMAFGAAIAMSGLMPANLNADSVEIGVSASVLAMGLLLLIQLPLKRPIQIALTAIFAMLHGFAHGLELSFSSGWSVMLGMLLATALLHALGLLLSSGRVTIAKQVNLVMGGLMLLTGAYLLAV